MLLWGMALTLIAQYEKSDITREHKVDMLEAAMNFAAVPWLGITHKERNEGKLYSVI